MQLLKQSTAATVVVGPVLDADGAAVTTAVAANFSIAKNGTVAALTSETVNHSANGYYTIELTSSNTNTLGRLDIIVNASTMSMANHRYDVLVAATYDAIVTTGVATGAQALGIQSRIPASLDLDGNMRSSVQSMASNVLTAAALASDAVTEIVAGVYNALPSAGWTNGSFGDRLLIGANNNRSIQVTGSNHAAADIHECQPNVINSAALASSAITEIQSGLATSAGVTAGFTEIKGTGWSSSTDTLEKIAESSGGGGSSIMVTPVVAQTPVRVVGSNISTFIGDLSTIRVGIFSGEDAVDLSAFGSLEVCVQRKNGTDLDFVEMPDLTIDGDGNNYVSWDPSGPSVAEVIRGKWSLRKSSNKQVIAYGAWIVDDAALEDVGS